MIDTVPPQYQLNWHTIDARTKNKNTKKAPMETKNKEKLITPEWVKFVLSHVNKK
jgi:hypothetical protein